MMLFFYKNGPQPTEVDKWQFSAKGFVPQKAAYEYVLYNVVPFVVGLQNEIG